MRPTRSPRSPFLLLLALAVLAALALPGAAGAQEGDAAPGDDRPLFVDRVDVNVVNVEVFVTDDQGRRVTGLEKDDFEILVDGEPVEISNFFAVAQTDRVQSELARSRAAREDGEAPPRESTIAPSSELPEEQQLNLVVYVDHFNLHPQSRTRALEELRGFLEDRMFQGDRIMLVGYDGQLEVVQPFTRDWSRVRRGLEELGEGKTMRQQQDLELRQALQGVQRAWREENSADRALAFTRSYIQEERVELRRSLSALERTVRAMAGLPGRKAILYVSDGLPQRPGEELYQYMQDIFGSGALRTGRGGTGAAVSTDPALESVTVDEGQLFDRVVREANAQQVTFYTVDAKGSQGDTSTGADVTGRAFLGGNGQLSLQNARTLNYQEPLIDMAESTGGASILNTYELADAFYRAGVDFDHFYSLGFRAPLEEDGSYHDVQVRVKRPGMEVRHRQGFRSKPAQERMADRTLASLVFEMESNPLGISLDFGAAQREKRKVYRVPMLVRIPIREVTLIPDGETSRGQLRIYLVVKDAEGGVSELHEETYPVEIPTDQLEAARDKEIGYGTTLQIQPGSPRVVVGVWDELSGSESFVHQQLLLDPRQASR